MSSSPDPVCFVSGVGNAVEQGTPLLSSPCLSYSLLSSHFPSSLLASVFSSPFSSCFLSSLLLSSQLFISTLSVYGDVCHAWGLISLLLLPFAHKKRNNCNCNLQCQVSTIQLSKNKIYMYFKGNAICLSDLCVRCCLDDFTQPSPMLVEFDSVEC